MSYPQATHFARFARGRALWYNQGMRISMGSIIAILVGMYLGLSYPVITISLVVIGGVVWLISWLAWNMIANIIERYDMWRFEKNEGIKSILR